MFSLPVSSKDKTLVVGGYGLVGSVVSTWFAKRYPGKVIAAGRRFEKAVSLAHKLPGRLLPLRLDLDDPKALESALDGVKLVVSCVERSDSVLARACLTRGVHFIDVSASFKSHQRVLALNDLAYQQGAAAVVGSGLVPGLSNLLAAYLAPRVSRPTRLDVHLMLGLGDAHGEDALRWLVAAADHRFSVQTRYGLQVVESLTDPKSVTFPGESRPRTTYRFDFADQHALPKTVGVSGAATRLCFDSRWLTRLLASLKRSGLLSGLQRMPLKAITTLLDRLKLGSNRFALVVEAHEDTAPHTRVRAAVRGQNETYITGMVTAFVADDLYRGRIAPGVHHIERVVQLEHLKQPLEKEGLMFWLNETADNKQWGLADVF